MIKILKRSDTLILEYKSDLGEAKWVDQALEQNKEVTIAHTFTFSAEQLLPSTDDYSLLDNGRTFILGVREGDYFRIKHQALH